MVRVSYKSQRVSNFHSSRSTATKNCLMPSKVNSSLWQTIGGHHGKVLFKVFVTFSSKNNYFFYANKNVTHRLTRILIGSVMNFCVISKISWGRVALNRTTWTHLKRIRIVILDSITSTFTADYKPLWVTWLDFRPTFAGISWCFQMQGVGFHVSHLPQLLFAWTFFSPYVYLSLIYKNNPFSICVNFNINNTQRRYTKKDKQQPLNH